MFCSLFFIQLKFIEFYCFNYSLSRIVNQITNLNKHIVYRAFEMLIKIKEVQSIVNKLCVSVSGC